ncbi:AraC family transcriptional regulator [Duganella callida]|uniref:AraC family transcriptional regulator n=1 Tax=Duganella callida TaxID=2561932 RepID=A0A4Y9S1J1_9BURK|nr:AraC family transcriptional regulator [Duganella callida]TFW13789.1 AraC family transcriptional regulator [Duganella callida]
MSDPLSDVLRLVSAHSVVSGGLVAGGSWAIAFPAVGTINFFGILRGSCWLIHGDQPPQRIGAGDILLRSAHKQLILCSDLDAAPVDLYTVVAGKKEGMSRLGAGDDFFMLGGKVALDADSGKLLLDALPATIRIAAGSPHAAGMQWLLQQLVQEQTSALPGTGAASSQLAHLLFIQVLRAYLADAGTDAAGWLRAASDPRLAPVLSMLHDEPGRNWQLGQLAKAAGMSRASFAAYFKIVAGVAPLTYLAHWRMRLAARDLRGESTTLAVLAQRYGYGSESAFSNAFKRITGYAPKSYRTMKSGV